MRGSVRYDTLATLVDVIDEDRKDINLNLIAKKKITGTVSLPEGTAPKTVLQLPYGQPMVRIKILKL